MRSPKEWWAAGGRPLSVRGHLYAIVFWLALGALVAYRMLAGDESRAFNQVLLLAAALLNLFALAVSYRGALRNREQPSSDGDDEDTAEAT